VRLLRLDQKIGGDAPMSLKRWRTSSTPTSRSFKIGAQVCSISRLTHLAKAGQDSSFATSEQQDASEAPTADEPRMLRAAPGSFKMKLFCSILAAAPRNHGH
jgi:hypothetical protein